MVKLLLKAGANPDLSFSFDKRQNPLALAIRGGNDDIIKILLKAGADFSKLSPQQSRHPLIQLEQKKMHIKKKRKPTNSPTKSPTTKTPARLSKEEAIAQIMKKVQGISYDQAMVLYKLLS